MGLLYIGNCLAAIMGFEVLARTVQVDEGLGRRKRPLHELELPLNLQLIVRAWYITLWAYEPIKKTRQSGLRRVVGQING